MKNKIILFFGLVVLIQLVVPAKMVWDQEVILKEGELFKFKTRPYDPYDPFRGKYVQLQFDAVEHRSYQGDWKEGEKAYVLLTTDAEGYAEIAEISRIPQQYWRPGYVEVSIRYVPTDDPHLLRISYPFNRFYMEESKAPAAEEYYREVTRDSSRSTYALVKVQQGKAVLMDVQVDGKSLSDLVTE